MLPLNSVTAFCYLSRKSQPVRRIYSESYTRFSYFFNQPSDWNPDKDIPRLFCKEGLEENDHISNEFGQLLFRVDIPGGDMVTGMNGHSHNTPSASFGTFAWT